MPGKGVVVLAETVSSQDAFVQLPSRPVPEQATGTHVPSRDAGNGRICGVHKWPVLTRPPRASTCLASRRFPPILPGSTSTASCFGSTARPAWRNATRATSHNRAGLGMSGHCGFTVGWRNPSDRHRGICDPKSTGCLSVPRRSSLPALHRDGKRGPAAREHERQGCRNQGEIQNWRTLFLMPLHLGCRNRLRPTPCAS